MQADATVAPTCIDIIYILHVYDDYRGAPGERAPKIEKKYDFLA